MKEQERVARIVYHEESPFNKEQEAWALELWDEDTQEWGLDTMYPFVHAKEYPEDANDYIHIGFVNEIRRLLDFGYTLSTRIVNSTDK